MPEDGSKLLDVAALADAAARVEISVPLAALERLKPLLVSADGRASGRIGFSRAGGHVVADVEANAALVLRCQRCLGEFVLPVDSRSRVALVVDESDATLPDDLETVLAQDGRMRLRDLVEEELLLAVPAVPRHPAGQCAAESGRDEAVDAAGSVETMSAMDRGTTRPFAGLADLLGSQGSKK